MDDYAGGIGTNYMTNGNMLKRGLQLLDTLTEDLGKIGAKSPSPVNESMGIKT